MMLVVLVLVMMVLLLVIKLRGLHVGGGREEKIVVVAERLLMLLLLLLLMLQMLLLLLLMLLLHMMLIFLSQYKRDHGIIHINTPLYPGRSSYRSRGRWQNNKTGIFNCSIGSQCRGAGVISSELQGVGQVNFGGRLKQVRFVDKGARI